MPVGEEGELCIAGPQVMKGYWNRPDETAIALREDAAGRMWLYTGDVARMDEDGYTYIVQRKKDMIIVSGFNVYPSEVEGVLYEHPAVMEAAVIGIPDAYRGEVVKACVVLKAGAIGHGRGADRTLHGAASPSSKSPRRSRYARACRRPPSARFSTASCARKNRSRTTRR